MVAGLEPVTQVASQLLCQDQAEPTAALHEFKIVVKDDGIVHLELIDPSQAVVPIEDDFLDMDASPKVG